MRKLMMAPLSAALLVAVAAAQAGGKTNIDPSVTQSAKKMQDSSRGTTKPKDTSVGTQPVQKPTGAGANSSTSPRQGIESNGTDFQGTDMQGLDSQGLESQGVDAQGVDGQGVDAQGTDAQGPDTQATQATQPPASLSHQLDTLSLRGERLVDVRLVEGELTARTAQQVLLPGR
jgi:hypothetical protein